MYIFSISVFVNKSSNNSCGKRFISKAGAVSLHAFNNCLTELLKCVQLDVLCFLVTLKQSKKKKESRLNFDNDKGESHVRLTKMHVPLILYSSLKVRQLKDLLLHLHLDDDSPDGERVAVPMCQIVIAKNS